MDRLHQRTSEALQRGLDQPQHEDQLIQETQQKARQLLEDDAFSDEQLHLCWMQLSTEYFLQTPPQAIAWHTRLLLRHTPQAQRFHVFIRKDEERGCSEIFTFGPDRDGIFAETTAALDCMAINILGARIDATNDGVSVNSYFVLEEDGSALSPARDGEIVGTLQQVLNNDAERGLPNARRMPRQLKSFVRDSTVSFTQDEAHAVTVLNIITHDRPGLLSLIGSAFVEPQLRLRSARIVTEGAIARDRFTLTDRDDQPLSNPQQLHVLQASLLALLDDLETETGT